MSLTVSERPPEDDTSVASPGPVPGQHRARRSRTARNPVLVIALADYLMLVGALVLTGALDVPGVLYIAGAVVMLAVLDLYEPRLNLRVADDSARIVGALGIPFAVLAVAGFAWSGLQIGGLTVLAAVAALLTGRSVAYALIRRLRVRGVFAERALIVGRGTVGAEIARVLREHPEYGLKPVAFVDGDQAGTAGPSGRGTAVSVHPSALGSVVRDRAVSRIIVAFSRLSDSDLVGLLRGCAGLRIKVYVVPRLFELGVTTGGPRTDDIWGFPLVRVKGSAERAFARRVKRAFDLVAGSILLVLSLPVFALSSAAVRLSSPGPALFRQKRIGDGGRVIEVLKFRTLLPNDDSDHTWSVRDDDRRTRVGRFLRMTGLDEVPQLVNVLRGDMSLIGPRPERPYFASRFAVELRGYRDRHRIRQGITGWAQVHGLRGDTSIADRTRFDNYYIENWSIWLDLRILARTVAAVLGKRGA